MKTNQRLFLGVISFCFLNVVCGSLCRADGPYHLLKEIPVGREGGWDYLSVDETNRRLYVSHATKVVVIDLAKEEVAGEITDTPGVHGLAPAPDLQRGVTSNGRENKASIVDLKTLPRFQSWTLARTPMECSMSPVNKRSICSTGVANRRR